MDPDNDFLKGILSYDPFQTTANGRPLREPVQTTNEDLLVQRSQYAQALQAGADTLQFEQQQGDFLDYDPNETFIQRVKRKIKDPMGATEWDEDDPSNTRYNHFDRAVGNAALRVTNHASNLAFATGKALYFGAWKAKRMLFGADTAEERRWEAMWARPTETQNPFQFTVGDRQEGAWGFFEGMTEVAMAYTITAGAMGGAGLLAKGTSWGQQFIRGMQIGAVGDFTFFHPTEDRLSDLIQDAEWIPDPVQKSALIDLMAADLDDNEFNGRLKGVLEGAIVGGSLEVGFKMVGGLLRKWRVSRQVADGKITPEEGLAKNAEIDADVRAAAQDVLPDMVGDQPVVRVGAQAREILEGRTPRRAAVKLDDGEIVTLPGKGHGDELGLMQLTDEQSARVERQGFIEPDGTFREGTGTVDSPVYKSLDWEQVPEELRADPDLREAVQKQGSGETDLGQIPGGFHAARNGGILKPGTRNFDVGGGASDLMTDAAAEGGVANRVWDPFQRDQQHNFEVAKEVASKPADTGTAFNVLNVIETAEGRRGVLETLRRGVKEGGRIVFQMYEGGSTGKVRKPSGKTSKGYQLRWLTEDYLDEIRQVFPDAEVERFQGGGKGKVKVIVATNIPERHLPIPFEAADATARPPSQTRALAGPAIRVGDQVWRLTDLAEEPNHFAVMKLAQSQGIDVDAVAQSGEMIQGFVTHNDKFVSGDEALKLFGSGDTPVLRERGVIGGPRDPYGIDGVADITERELAKQRAADAAAEAAPREEIIQARSPEEAAAMAEIIREEVVRRRRALEGKPISIEVDEAGRAAVRKSIDTILEQGDIGTPRAVQGVHFNVPYFDSTDNIKAMILSLSDVFGDAIDAARQNTRNVDKVFTENVTGRRTMQQIHRAASYIVDHNDTDTLVDFAAELAGNSQKLPQVILALRQVLLGTAERATRLGRLLDANPDNPLFQRVFAQELDRVVNLGLSVGATESSLGRALRTLQETVEPRLPGRRIMDDSPVAPKGKKAPEGTSKPREASGKRDPLKDIERTLERDGRPRIEDPFGNVLTPNPVSRFLAEKMPSGAELRAAARGITLADGDFGMLLKGTRLFMEELSPELRALRKTASANARASMKDPPWWRKLLGFRVGMMLTGPATMIVNGTSTAANLWIRPAEDVLGGFLVKTFGTNKDLRAEGARVMRVGIHTLTSQLNLHMTLNDIYGNAWRQAKLSLKDMESNLDAIYTRDETGWLQVRDAEDQLGIFAKISGFGLRGLLTTDTYLKEIAYRSRVRALAIEDAYTQAAEVGASMSEEYLNDFIREYMRHSVDPEGGARIAQALAHARDVTYQTALEHGTLAKWVDNLANQDNVAGAITNLILPFRRTPANLWRWPIERFPVLGNFSRQMREDIAAGGQRMSRALGKQVFGTMLYGTAATLVVQGRLTGYGPRNPDLRKQMTEELGWQPYSVRVGDNWYSYRRFDPIATPLALIADFAQSYGEFETADARETGVAAMIAMTTQNLSSKNFMRGATEFMEAATGGDPAAMERWLGSVGSSFIPAIARAGNQDDVVREAQTVLERIGRTTPWWSPDMEPARNHWGEIVYKPQSYAGRLLNPFTVMKAEDVKQEYLWELTTLGKALPEPAVDARGLDLRDRSWDTSGKNQSPWDRMYELLKDPEIDAKRKVIEVMESPEWQDGELGEGTLLQPGGTKYNLIAGMYQGFFEKALQMVMDEPRYAGLRDRWVEEKVVDAVAPLLHENVFQHHVTPEERVQAADSLRKLKANPEERREMMLDTLLRRR